jgi:hypothetical protein
MATRKGKAASAPKGAPPSSLTIRMYNVGFGDCFLLTFHYAKEERHMLVDYGSTAAPKGGPADYMAKVAEDIKKQTKGKLNIVVATHRHRDHISGFATDGAGTGKTIASLKPDVVIQPWTEDPNTKPNASTATSSSFTSGKPDEKQITSHFLGSLEDMHRVAESIARLATNPAVAGRDTRNQLSFLGEDNLKNLSAVKCLMDMGKRAKAYYVNAGMQLNDLLPGVKITVLGPPTLKQSESIRKERSKDPSEFWQFRSFWASQRLAVTDAAAVTNAEPLFPNNNGTPAAEPDPNIRWFIRQSRNIHADQLLELVRDLDSVMNNTSVILLFEIGDRKLLFPGDAQIENWSFALNTPELRNLLKDVNLYKVGHHGSLNATPKSLWALFDHKGGEHTHDRLDTLCSTKSGKHGSAKSGTEVPRHVLVDELKKDSVFVSTEDFAKNTLFSETTISIAKKAKRAG